MSDESVVASKAEPQTFSLDYVKELREENKAHRLTNSELAAKLKTSDESLNGLKTESEAKLTEAQKKASERVLLAELKVAAKDAGLIDLDALKLADLSKVVLKDDGTIEGVETLFKGLKETKPYLFGDASSSTTKEPPKKEEARDKKASEMTPEEYAKKKAELTRG